MTIDEALALNEGDTVCHPAKLAYTSQGIPVKAPMRITKVWVNAKRTIVLVRINEIAKEQWLDATAYEFPPAGLVYDKFAHEWLTPKELKERKEARAR